MILSPTAPPTPSFNPYVVELQPSKSNTVITVNSSAQAVTTNPTGGSFAGFYRHFGVNGNLALGTGYETGYNKRNVFSVDLVDVGDESFLNFSVNSQATAADGYKFGIQFEFQRQSNTNYDVKVIWRYGTGFTYKEVTVLTNQSAANLAGTYQIEFYNPVYNIPNTQYGTIDWDWQATKDGVSLASSAGSNGKAIWRFFGSDMCNDTGISVNTQNLYNAIDFTIDNFGIGLNGNLGCLPLPVPPV